MTAIGERYLSASTSVIAMTGDPTAEGGLMDERDVLAGRFDAERGRLRAVAYRMLGSERHLRQRHRGAVTSSETSGSYPPAGSGR